EAVAPVVEPFDGEVPPFAGGEFQAALAPGVHGLHGLAGEAREVGGGDHAVGEGDHVTPWRTSAPRPRGLTHSCGRMRLHASGVFRRSEGRPRAGAQGAVLVPAKGFRKSPLRELHPGLDPYLRERPGIALPLQPSLHDVVSWRDHRKMWALPQVTPRRTRTGPVGGGRWSRPPLAELGAHPRPADR